MPFDETAAWISSMCERGYHTLCKSNRCADGCHARRCPHGCSHLAATAGHEAGCPIGATFVGGEHDQSACPTCSAYFTARGEAVPGA